MKNVFFNFAVAIALGSVLCFSSAALAKGKAAAPAEHKTEMSQEKMTPEHKAEMKQEKMTPEHKAEMNKKKEAKKEAKAAKKAAN